jgi:hypothetical protein
MEDRKPLEDRNSLRKTETVSDTQVFYFLKGYLITRDDFIALVQF